VNLELLASPAALIRQADPVVGLALLALLAVLAASLLRRMWGVPRVMGMMLVGALASPMLLNLLQQGDLDPWKPLIDLAVAAMLFELGSRLRPRWLIDNPWLAASCLAEGGLAAAVVAIALIALDAPVESAWMAGAVAASTSPLISLAAVHEWRPRGQVAERLLTMCAINSLLAMLAIRLWPLLPALGPAGSGEEVLRLATQTLTVICGSFLLGVAGAWVLEQASRTSRDEATMPVLQIAMVVLAAMLATSWNLSPLLTLLTAGMVARVRMQHRLNVQPQLGSAGAALTVLLFISLGLMSSTQGWRDVWPWVAAIIAARLVGKGLAVALLARPSGLGWRQALGLTLALQPMGGLAVLLVAPTFALGTQLSGADAQVLQALVVATTLMQITGPLWAHAGLCRVADECPRTEPRDAA
jgi:Kef-type K+ transport system membrane component KefB